MSFAYAAAWGASIALLAAPFPGPEAGAFSRAAAAALPWLALAGLPPARSREPGERAGASALRWSAGALAPLLVGARLDQLDGLAAPAVALVPAACLAMVAGLAFGAARGGGRPLCAVLWGVLVLGLPALAAVWSLFPPEPVAAGLVRWCAAPSPVAWAWGAARAAHGGDTGPPSNAWSVAAPLATTALLALAARRGAPPDAAGSAA
jgi:hypothetical protein